MELAPAGAELTFEVTYDSPSLAVAMSVYDTTGVSPVLVQGPAAMTVIVANTYIGKFTPEVGKSYLIFKAVYTSGAFTTLSSDYSQGTESLIVEDVGGGGGSADCGTVVGYVTNPTVIGLVQPTEAVVGFINC